MQVNVASRCRAVAVLCGVLGLCVAVGAVGQTQPVTPDPVLGPGAVRTDPALSPDQTNPAPVLSPGAVPTDPALSPQQTRPDPVLAPDPSDTLAPLPPIYPRGN
jgi:hypothetical protein